MKNAHHQERIDKNIKVHSFGEKKHTLTADEHVLSFNGQVIFLKDVTHFKFGLQPIQVYRFAVAWKYQLSLKTATQQLDIIFKSYFNLRNRYFYKLFHHLSDIVWQQIGDRLFQETVALLTAGGVWQVGNCRLSKEGIRISRPGLRAEQQHLLPWADVSYEKKHDRLVINSKSNPGFWTNLYYLEHWNVDTAMNVLDWLLEEDGLRQLS